MKNKLFTIAALSFGGCLVSAQVGINTPDASAMLDIVTKGNTSATKALEVNNSSGTEMVTVLNNGNVGINIANPNAKLHIVSASGNGFQLADGSQGANKVLTSDANGIGTWQAAPAAGITSITGTSPITASTTSGATTIGINRNDIVQGTSAANATNAFAVSGGLLGSVVGGSNISMTVNNTAPFWNANQLQGTAVANTTPTNNQVLTFNGTSWVPSTPTPQSADWHTSGNTDAEITTGTEALGSAPTGNYVGISGGTDVLVLATAGVTHGILNNTGSLTGGNKGTGGASISWGSNNTINGTQSNIALGRDNIVTAANDNFISTAIGRNNIPSAGATAIGFYNGYSQDTFGNPVLQSLTGSGTFALGRYNYGTGGMSVGYFNNNSGGMAFGYGLKASSSGVAIGSTGSVGATPAEAGLTNSMYIGAMGGKTYLSGETLYSNASHVFASGTDASGIPLTGASVFINRPIEDKDKDGAPGNAANIADLYVNKAVNLNVIADTTITTLPPAAASPSALCNSNTEGNIIYLSGANANTTHFYGCLKTGGVYSWKQLDQ